MTILSASVVALVALAACDSNASSTAGSAAAQTPTSGTTSNKPVAGDNAIQTPRTPDDEKLSPEDERAERIAEERLAADAACPSGNRHRCDDVDELVKQLEGDQPDAVLAEHVAVSSCKKRKLSRHNVLDWMGRTPILFPHKIRCKDGCCVFELGDSDAPGDAGVIAKKACFESGHLVRLETSCNDRS